jgi:hypothetical protein
MAWEARDGAPSLDTAGRRYGHDVYDEDHLSALMHWASAEQKTPQDMRSAAFMVLSLLYFARDGTMDGMKLSHLHWGKAGLRLFEAKFKLHADTAGARVLFTPYDQCKDALEVVRRYTKYLERWGVKADWPMWQLPFEKAEPKHKDHLAWVREAVRMAGCDVPFGMKIDLHMNRATPTCHSLALGVPRPVVQYRAGWASLSSMDAYARPIICGPTSRMLFAHLKLILNTD